MTDTTKDTDRKPKQDDDDQVFRLTNIRPPEVSVVDLPANEEPFTIVKRHQGDSMGAEIVTKEDGSLAYKDDGDGQGVEKQKRFAADTRTAAEKLISLANQAKGGDITPAMGKELKSIVTMLSSLMAKYPSPTSKADDGDGAQSDDVQKQAMAHRTLVQEKSAGLQKAIDKVTGMLAADTPTSDLTEATRNLTDLAWSFGDDVRDYSTMIAKCLAHDGVPFEGSKEAAEALLKTAKVAIDQAIEKGAQVKQEKPEEDMPGKPKPFTPKRRAAVSAALKTLLGVMKDLGIGFADMAKAAGDGEVDADAVTKAIESLAEPGGDGATDELKKQLAERDTTIADLAKRLDALESAGVTKSLSDDGDDAGTPTEKSDGMWSGLGLPTKQK
jgi:hypothetical protein